MVRPSDDGYATPAAAVISAALSLVVTAVAVRGLADVRLAKAELARTQVEYELGSAQNAAMLAIATSSQPPPYRWVLPNLGAAVEVLAEPEYLKMSPAAFAGLPDASLAAFDVGDLGLIRSRLADVTPGAKLPWIADLAPSPTWRSCAPSAVSAYGQAPALPVLAYGEPLAGRQPGFWRAGEVWRIQVTGPGGWRDERIVRFSGNGLDPAATLGRRLSRAGKGTQAC